MNKILWLKFSSTVNGIEEEGSVAFGQALNSNTTLTNLCLYRNNKRTAKNDTTARSDYLAFGMNKQLNRRLRSILVGRSIVEEYDIDWTES